MHLQSCILSILGIPKFSMTEQQATCTGRTQASLKNKAIIWLSTSPCLNEWPVEMTDCCGNNWIFHTSQIYFFFLLDILSISFFFFFSPRVTLGFERNASLHHKWDTLQGEINEGAIVWFCPRPTVKRILWLFIVPGALWPEQERAIYQYSKCSHSKTNKSWSVGGTLGNWIADTQPADIRVSGLIRLNYTSPTSLKVTLYNAFRLLLGLFFFCIFNSAVKPNVTAARQKLCKMTRGRNLDWIQTQ